MAQSILLTKLTSTQTDPYSVDGLTLGSKVAFGTPAYRQYRCGPSRKFEGFVWCTKTISDKEVRGRIKASILHAQDGTIVYVNRYQEPAYWSANEVADDIERYSSKIGEEPHVIQLPARPGLPQGILVTRGKVVLEPIVGDELRFLGEDKPLEKGIAIDFIGNFTQSARQGLPIYRLAGGAGFVWAASYNQGGRGTLRFSAVDASIYSPQSLPASAPPSLAADPPGGAATAVDTPAVSYVVAPPRDPNELVAQVLNHSTKPLQQTDPADGAQYARESGTSNFRSTESEQVMLDLVVTHWVWIISALIASGIAGYWSTRPQESRGRGVLGWQGWASLAFVIGGASWPCNGFRGRPVFILIPCCFCPSGVSRGS
jgi:hypothetical protein